MSYWWLGKQDSRGWSMLAWDRVCRSKRIGGMGFRDLKLFNIALMGNQVWKLIHDEESLEFKVLKAKYFPHSNFLEARLGDRYSYVWASIIKAKDTLSEGFLWRVRITSSSRMFLDKWGVLGPLRWNERYMDNSVNPVKVADFMLPDYPR
ncbi:uncharacterized mitochondrial protein AtMg00310-like [Hibiscus syriacus]|uniref:uncharacterized mitochondrial protein AtMg00310-like n=1 Tax=Hibiscus syriacus TaxID=106335 RepID=UPI0019230CAC|nr:uncharacterized mitochondrial protein AtMg00310-like [Hibiscus syriacus]